MISIVVGPALRSSKTKIKTLASVDDPFFLSKSYTMTAGSSCALVGDLKNVGTGNDTRCILTDLEI